MSSSATTSDALREIRELEEQIGQSKQQLAKLRRALPAEPVDDYTFTTPDGTRTLSELFGERDELLVIHNMGASCSYCTLWADGFNGLADHLADRAAFVVSSPDAPDAQQELAKTRGWRFPMVSVAETTFTQDMGYAEGNDFHPGVSAFVRGADGSISRVAHTWFGPGDNYCAMWDLHDLLPERDWSPRMSYAD